MGKRAWLAAMLAAASLASVLTLRAGDDTSSLPAPPVAKKIPHITEIHGRQLVDDYYWLRDRDNPDVRAYLEAENAYTDAVMQPTLALQKKLYDELLARVKETDTEVPYRLGGYFYYTRTQAGQQYAIHCRRKGSMDAPEEIILDVNELAKGQAFMSLGALQVSDDGNLLAYSSDNVGFRQFHLAVKDLRTGTLLPDHAERVDSIAWAADNKTLFYTVEDAQTKRVYQLYRHMVSNAGVAAHFSAPQTEHGGQEARPYHEERFLVPTSGTRNDHGGAGDAAANPDLVSNAGVAAHFSAPQPEDGGHEARPYESPAAGDALVYEEKDERFDIFVERTRSKAYLLLGIASHTTSEMRYLRADAPAGDWRVIEPRRQDVEYYAEHNGDFFWIRANDTGRNFRLVKAPVAHPGASNWQEVIPQRQEVMLEDIDFFKDYYILSERERGLPQMRAVALATGAARRIEFPERAYVAYGYINREYDTAKFRYGYQSFITPASVFEFDMATGAAVLLKQKEVPGGYDRARYEVERVEATAADGVKVPISIVHLKGRPDAQGAIYLTGYGSYGFPYDISFNSNLFSLVDRGVVCAVAHIRGGGEMGKAWHDDGRMMHKKNTFTDFIAAAEFLTQQGYGTKDRLVIEGRSAGGLLMGAVLNLRPDLFHAALVGVPFVDVINTMLDETLPLTVPEFEEWGNPKEKAAFEYMMGYSPYDNIAAKAYPSILVRTSFHDSQVMYWEPAKYVAKMRALRTDRHVLILKTNMQPAGHGGQSGRYDRLHDVAFDYAFFLTQMGLHD